MRAIEGEHPKQAAYREHRAARAAVTEWREPTAERRAEWDAWLAANRVEYAANRRDDAGAQPETRGGE